MSMIKKFILLSAAVLGLVFSCKPADLEKPSAVPAGYGTLNIEVVQPEMPGTKAVSAYTTEATYEKQVNKVQVFIFYSGGAQDGVLAKKISGTTATSYSAELPVGSYKVYVQVNGADKTPAKLADFTAYTAALTVNSTAAATGFLMVGNNNATVAASGTSNCAVTVNRLLNRICLMKIANGMPSTTITVNRIWLANIVTTQNYANTVNGNSRTWAHKFSRSTDFTTSIPALPTNLISSFTAASLTSKSLSSSNTIAAGANISTPASYLFYAYANLKSASAAEDTKAFTTGSSAVTAWTPTQTRLVVEATIGSTKYYYPCDVTLLGMNKAHTVEMTISGPGLTDPQGDPADLAKQALTVNITVAGWGDGDEYELSY